MLFPDGSTTSVFSSAYAQAAETDDIMKAAQNIAVKFFSIFFMYPSSSKFPVSVFQYCADVLIDKHQQANN